MKTSLILSSQTLQLTSSVKRLLLSGLALGMMSLNMALVFSPSAVSAATTTPPAPAGPTKAEALTRLKAIQAKQNNEIQSIDDALRKRFGDSTQIDMHQQNSKLSDRRVTQLTGHIEDLSQRRAELTARRDFMNMLIFTIDTKWNGQNFNKFLEFTFLDMAMTDISDTRTSSHLWKFLTYASITVREAPEPHEDVINVLESYINFSGLLEPKSPAVFLAGRSYTNGNLSYSAKGVPADQVGDAVENQIRALDADAKKKLKPKQKEAADIELRIPPLPLPAADSAGTTSGAGSKSTTKSAAGSASTAAPAPVQTPVASPVQKTKDQNLTPPPISNQVDPTNGTVNPPMRSGQPAPSQNN